VANEKRGFSIGGLQQETENGQTVYEAKVRYPGGFHKTDKSVTMDASGRSSRLKNGFQSMGYQERCCGGLLLRRRTAKWSSSKEITKNAHLVAYEAKVMKDGKKSEVQVGPDGRLLDYKE
jgi:hypothetical protein